jgi:uncharacterized protein (TIGR00266 family)
MRVEIRHSPAYAVARCHIQPGSYINVESGAMMAQSPGITVESSMGEGGLFGAAKRAILSGDSFFVSKFIGDKQYDTWVDVVPTIPGDIFELSVEPGKDVILTKGVWLASDPTVKLDPKFGNSGSFFGGEGLFLVKASGQGTLVANAYGALDVHTLQQGEQLIVDTGHLVAYENGVQIRTRKIASGFLNTMKSGEGLVMEFTGPGDVITQSRNPSAFQSWVASMIPSSR